MFKTHYLCPSCNGRIFVEDSTKYLCDSCGEEYDRQILAECFKGEHADLVSDAETVKSWIDELEAQ